MNDTNDKPLRVIGVQTENVGRLTLIDLRPRPRINVVSGRNGQGKSTLLLSMQAALEGKKALPACPIRRGQTKAKTRLELGGDDGHPEFIVEQRISEAGATTTVTAADGAKYPSPQKLLAGLCDHIAFDPQEFARMEPDKQDLILKEMCGLDFSKLDGERDRVFADRANVNREVKSLEARIGAMQMHHDAPTAEIVVSDLVAQLEDLRETIAVNNAARQEVASLQRNADSAREAVARCDQEIVELEAKLVKARERRDLCATKADEAMNAHENGRRAAAELQDPDTGPVKAQIASAEDTNRKIRANAERSKLVRELGGRKEQSEAMTQRLRAIDEEKQGLIAAANFPIEGLGFSDLGPTYQGLPIAQASESQKLILGSAIGLAMHPRLRTMWLDRASGLDDQTLAELERFAEENDAQFFVEMVRTNDPAAIVIQDGAVVEKAAE